MAKNTKSGCLGCGCLLSPFLFLYIHFAVIWPVGSVLLLGDWFHTEGDANSDGGWTFRFDHEYSYVPWLVAVLFLVWMWVVSKLSSRFIASQSSAPANKKFLQLPQPKYEPAAWQTLLDEGSPQILHDYHSDGEVSNARRTLPFPLGVVIMGFGPASSSILVSILDVFPSDLIFLRGLVLAVPLAFGAGLMAWGLKLAKAQTNLDERLIIDFEKREVQKIALHDAWSEPVHWFAFDGVQRLSVTRRGEDRPSYRAHLIGPGAAKVLLISGSGTGPEPLLNRLAEAFGTNLDGFKG